MESWSIHDRYWSQTVSIVPDSLLFKQPEELVFRQLHQAVHFLFGSFEVLYAEGIHRYLVDAQL